MLRGEPAPAEQGSVENMSMEGIATAERQFVGTAPDLPVSAPSVTYERVKRTLDVTLASLMLLSLVPILLIVALAIVLDSRGPVFYMAQRVGRDGRPLRMFKFRKMGRDAAGLPLTMGDDQRFTRIGRFLTRTKFDEIPQLLNVVRGDMSLIGPRPEDPEFVAERREDYDEILRVRPGITGYSQIAFADEGRILSPADPIGDYRERIFPQKCGLDRLYVRTADLRTDLRILAWTIIAVALRRPVAVDRATGRLGVRRRPAGA